VILPTDWLSATDAAVCSLLLPLAVWILISGLDDIIVDLAGLLAAVANRFKSRPSRRRLLQAEQRAIAIFVPCWHEHGVIAAMVERNRDRILYRNRDFFIGVYPNDEATVETVRALNERFPDVHLALCPHDGPTSKADCLNWIYQRMLLYEAESGVRFDVIVTHDAEDVIDTDALHWINWYARDYDMVQVPVLPLPTPLLYWTHGVYCDEFAEYQARDMPARQFMGAFVPSNGVGTGFRRDALEELAASEANRIFEPACLTEDYENGLRLKLRGAKQIFVAAGHSTATREYFPQTFRAAVRQRARWVTGIALQTWARHGWKGGLATKYWLWRDRKGLIGNPASLLTNVVFAYGAITWAGSRLLGVEWALEQAMQRALPLVALTSFMGVYRLAFRAICVWPQFGLAFALLAPVRVIVANAINSAATLRALYSFGLAHVRGQPLRWVKTEHQYPNPAALAPSRRKLGEILVGSGYLEAADLERALATQPADLRIGEHLLALGLIEEDALYEALALQSGMPLSWIDPGSVAVSTARSVPARVARQCKLIPFKVEEGRIYLAGPEEPSRETERLLRRVSSLTPKFWLVTPSNFALLVERFL
jgi:bacteriophage N4 adsorption protein B